MNAVLIRWANYQSCYYEYHTASFIKMRVTIEVNFRTLPLHLLYLITLNFKKIFFIRLLFAGAPHQLVLYV
jgi:hypothetical protein